VITGRGPGAPGMPPVAADLSEIRQAEEAIDRLDRNVNARLLTEVYLLDWPHE